MLIYRDYKNFYIRFKIARLVLIALINQNIFYIRISINLFNINIDNKLISLRNYL